MSKTIANIYTGIMWVVLVVFYSIVITSLIASYNAAAQNIVAEYKPTISFLNEPLVPFDDEIFTEIELIELPPIPPVLTEKDQQQIECMALNTYFEARGESRQGQYAVNHVVMNRVSSEDFPNTPCEVIYQRNRRVCQFSWVCERGKYVRNHDLYADLNHVAKEVYVERSVDNTRGARFYHANYVNPRWRLNRTVVIGWHVFYR